MVNWMSIQSMFALIILIDPHTNSVYIFMSYTQAYINSEISMELPIGFGVEGPHSIYWIIIMDIKLYGLKYSGLIWFEKLKEGLEAKWLSNTNWIPVYGIGRKWFHFFIWMIF